MPATEVRYEYRREVKEPFWTWAVRFENDQVTGLAAHPEGLPLGYLQATHYPYNTDAHLLDLYRRVETEYLQAIPA